MAARRVDRLADLVAQIRQDGGVATAVATDVVHRDQVDKLATETLKQFGKVDVLINNAGIMPLSPIGKLRVAEWDRTIDVNVKGLLYCVAAFLPMMLQAGEGHIVNVGSLAGRRPFPGGTVYSASKSAVRAISAGLRAELSPSDNIRVTDIEPGLVATELADHIPDREMQQTFVQRWEGKRQLAAEDIARAILFVVSQPEHVNVNELLVRPTEQDT